MSEINIRVVNNDESGKVEVYATSNGTWTAAAIVAAFEGFGKALVDLLESAVNDLPKESRCEFIIQCCLAITKKLMHLSDKY